MSVSLVSLSQTHKLVQMSHLVFVVAGENDTEGVGGHRGQHGRAGGEQSCEPHHRVAEGLIKHTWPETRKTIKHVYNNHNRSVT